jgi:hypothetical protein
MASICNRPRTFLAEELEVHWILINIFLTICLTKNISKKQYFWFSKYIIVHLSLDKAGCLQQNIDNTGMTTNGL